MFTLDELPFERLRLRPSPTRIDAYDTLWVKREDETTGPYGGNKVRKLEWLLPEARDRGGEVITAGPLGSHWVLAAAIYGRQLGLRVHAVLWPEADLPEVREHARAIHAHADRIWTARSLATVPLVLGQAAMAARLFAWFPPMILPIGGSSPRGCLGMVELGLEIALQVEAGVMPTPERVYVALGSGGTAAGLWCGLRLGGLESELVAVDVVGFPSGYRAHVWAQAARIQALLREHGAPAFALDGLRVVHACAPGYALPNAASERGRAVADSLGFSVDAAYTSKTLGVCEAEGGGPRLFVNTGNSRPMAPLLADALDEVPASLAGLLIR